jgi:hypothetical protein
MRNWIETDTHRQCCFARCKTMVKKPKNERQLSEAVSSFGSIASGCTKCLRKSWKKAHKRN